MEFTLNTLELQDIVIALICNNSSVLRGKQETVAKLIDLFAEINQELCTKENGYTVQFTAK